MKVLVTFAVPAEFAPWRRRHDFRRVPNKVVTAFKGQIADAQVVVLLTGVGGDFAAARLRLLLATYGVVRGLKAGRVQELMRTESESRKFDFCISSGLAGALQSNLSLGDVVVAPMVRAESVHHHRKKSEVLGDAELTLLATNCGAKIVETFYTSSRIIFSAAQKAELRSVGDAVEMESFDTLVEAWAWGVRAVAIRAISDTVRDDLPLDFSKTLTKLGHISVRRMILEIVRRPRQIPSLVRFGWRSRHAAIALADFLDCYVAALSSVGLPAEPRREVVPA